MIEFANAPSVSYTLIYIHANKQMRRKIDIAATNNIKSKNKIMKEKIDKKKLLVYTISSYPLVRPFPLHFWASNHLLHIQTIEDQILQQQQNLTSKNKAQCKQNAHTDRD